MRIESKGLFYRHWEKIICLVVMLGLIVAVIYAARRATVTEKEDLRVQIKRLAAKVEARIDDPAPPEPIIDYFQMAKRRYEEVVKPQTIREWVMWFPLPQVYPVQRVGFEQDIKLRFNAPLDRGSVRVEGVPKDVAWAEYPVGVDYRLVMLHTGRPEQDTVEFKVVGTRGLQRHIQPIIIDKEVGGRVRPPLELTAIAERGYVELRFKPNPENKGLGVESYSVYRRSASALGGEFEFIGMVQASEPDETEKELEQPRELVPQRRRPEYTPGGRGQPQFLPTTPPTGRLRPMREGEVRPMGPMGPMGPTGPSSMYEGPLPPGGIPGVEMPYSVGPTGRIRPKERVEEYVCYDAQVLPGETYEYKVRTNAKKSHPPQSEFSETSRATTLRDVAFRFTGGLPNRVRFEVIKVFAGGQIEQETFMVGIGEEIGGIKVNPRTGVQKNFLTGCYRKVKRIRRDISRIVFLDQRGNLKERWRRESPSDLWDLAKAKAPGPRGPGVPYPMEEMSPAGEFERLFPTGFPPPPRRTR